VETAAPVGELTTVADDEAVIHDGTAVHTFDELPSDTVLRLDGHEFRTLPRRGERLATFATVNDVHFGETVCGHIDGLEGFATYSVGPDEEPYPELMNAGAVSEMSAVDPDLVVAKGDLTSNGTESEYQRFLDVYGTAFGARLLHVRGNHESYHGLQCASWPMQERHLPGVTVALLDTSRDGRANGDLSAEQLEWLDELASRADRPVLVFGHHPIWNHEEEPRSDSTFGLVPAATEGLDEVFARRPRLVAYFAGHTHRNRVVRLPVSGSPSVEVACVKDYPGTWAEYRVHEGSILQVHRRISTPAALDWTERTRHMFGGAYQQYALGALDERCFALHV
jgi:3',5'-cyclic-AMP phosphodiesterase